MPWADAEARARHPRTRTAGRGSPDAQKGGRGESGAYRFQRPARAEQDQIPSLPGYLPVTQQENVVPAPLSLVTWEQLRKRFGSSAQTMKQFKQMLKAALTRVRDTRDGLGLAVNDDNGVALFPSVTHVPSLAGTKKREPNKKFAARSSASHPRSLPPVVPTTVDTGRTSWAGEGLPQPGPVRSRYREGPSQGLPASGRVPVLPVRPSESRAPHGVAPIIDNAEETKSSAVRHGVIRSAPRLRLRSMEGCRTSFMGREDQWDLVKSRGRYKKWGFPEPKLDGNPQR